MYGCPGVQVYVCTGGYNYIGVQVLIGAQMYRCTNVKIGQQQQLLIKCTIK